MADRKDPPLATGATAEVLPWKDGQVLKLFRERSPYHQHELAATRAASATGLPVPAVIDGLIEFENREGIVFERVDGPTMTRHLEDHSDMAIECAGQMADLHLEIHQREVSDIVDLEEVLTWAIDRADGLTPGIGNTVLGVLKRLPSGTALCHGDFHPHNIIMATRGPVAVDWAVGARGNPVADSARTWLISRLWLSDLERGPAKQYWSTFWQAYLSRYRELRPCPEGELINWKIVTTAASLGLVGPLSWIPAAKQLRIDFLQAILEDDAHRWKN
jgi:Ser/Thr protein kinase RdoA (MazF antagonist)